jgi:hypothetical protein
LQLERTPDDGGRISSRGRFVNQQTDHGWKHDHLRIHTATGGCDCSLKELLMMVVVFPAVVALLINIPTTATPALARQPEAATAV